MKTWRAVQPIFLAFSVALWSPPLVGMWAPMRVAGIRLRVPATTYLDLFMNSCICYLGVVNQEDVKEFSNYMFSNVD